MPGLCRVVFTRGESKGPGNSPKYQITRGTAGIIRKAALWCSVSKEDARVYCAVFGGIALAMLLPFCYQDLDKAVVLLGVPCV